jgi:hypothetical protein
VLLKKDYGIEEKELNGLISVKISILSLSLKDLIKFSLSLVFLLDPCLALILLDSAFCQKSLSMLENKQDL